MAYIGRSFTAIKGGKPSYEGESTKDVFQIF